MGAGPAMVDWRLNLWWAERLYMGSVEVRLVRRDESLLLLQRIKSRDKTKLGLQVWRVLVDPASTHTSPEKLIIIHRVLILVWLAHAWQIICRYVPVFSVQILIICVICLFRCLLFPKSAFFRNAIVLKVVLVRLPLSKAGGRLIIQYYIWYSIHKNLI